MNLYLKKLIEETDMPVIFDYDGVLFEARWYEERINMPKENFINLLEVMKRGENLYTAPIPVVQQIVENIASPKFVLSHIHNDIEFINKVKEINQYYPSIPTENIIRADSAEDKIEKMEAIKRKYGPFIYIDDTLPFLNMFENYFDTDCKFFHASSLFV